MAHCVIATFFPQLSPVKSAGRLWLVSLGSETVVNAGDAGDTGQPSRSAIVRQRTASACQRRPMHTKTRYHGQIYVTKILSPTPCNFKSRVPAQNAAERSSDVSLFNAVNIQYRGQATHPRHGESRVPAARHSIVLNESSQHNSHPWSAVSRHDLL